MGGGDWRFIHVLPAGIRNHETGASDIEEENEDQDSLVSPTLSRKSLGGGERTCTFPKQPSPPRSPRSRRESMKGRAKARGCESERCGDIIIRVEDVEGCENPCGGESGGAGPACPDGKQGCGEVPRQVQGAKRRKEGRDNRVHRAASLRSVESPMRKAALEAGRGGSSRRSSASEGGTHGSDSEMPRSPAESERRAVLLAAEEAPPKRKKSLTWSEDTPTPDTSDRESRGVPLEVEEAEPLARDSRRRASSSSRRSSRGSEKKKLRHTRSCELGDAAARRRGSGLSTSSSRGTDHTTGFPGPGLSLGRAGPSSPCSMRRGSRRSVKDEMEVETLLSRSPNGRHDVTLTSILNHIAYVNQAAAAPRLPASFKDSRKAQVQQVSGDGEGRAGKRSIREEKREGEGKGAKR